MPKAVITRGENVCCARLLVASYTLCLPLHPKAFHICYASAVYLINRGNLTFTAIFLVLLTNNSTHSSTRQTPQRRMLQKTLFSQVKNVRVLAPPMLFNVELRRQSQPLTF